MKLVLLIIISYFSGAIPIGFLIGKIITARLKHKDKLKNHGYFASLRAKFKNGWDIRKFGSGNPGGTNVFRVFKRVPKIGPAPGVITILVQALMSFSVVLFLAPYFANGINTSLCQVIAGLFCVLGNSFTVFFPSNFKGGKAVATATGVFAALMPLPVVFAFLIWLAIVKLKGIVSLGSIVSPFALLVDYFIYLWIFGLPVFSVDNSPKTIFIIILAGFILYTHRKNIKALLQGKENSFKK